MTEEESGNFAKSPVNGEITKVDCKPGDKVTAGQKLAVVIAMKMENVIVASRDGTVAKVYAEVGDKIGQDQPIIEFEHETKDNK